MVSRKRIFEIAETEKKKRGSKDETLFEVPLKPARLQRFIPILETGGYLDYRHIIIPKPILENINANPGKYKKFISTYEHGQNLIPGKNDEGDPIIKKDFAGYFDQVRTIDYEYSILHTSHGISRTYPIPESVADNIADIIENRPTDFFEDSIYDDLTLWETDNLDLIYGDMENRIIENASKNDRSTAMKFGVSNALKSTLLSALELKHSYPPSIAANIEGTYPSAIPATIHGINPSNIFVNNEVVDFIKQYLTDSGYLKGQPILSSSDPDIILEQDMDGEGEFVEHTDNMEEESFEIKYHWISEGIISDRLHTLLNNIYKTENNSDHDLITRYAYIRRMNNKWFKISDLFEDYILCIDMHDINLYKYSSFQSFDMESYSEEYWCVPHDSTKVRIPTKIQKEVTNSYRPLHMESDLHEEEKELYNILIIEDDKEWYPVSDLEEQIETLINKIKHEHGRRDKIYTDALELKTLLGGNDEWRDRLYKLRGEPIKKRYRGEFRNLRRTIENEELKNIINDIFRNFPLIDYKDIRRDIRSLTSETYEPVEALLDWCENNRPIPYPNDFKDKGNIDRTYSDKRISLIGSEERISHMRAIDITTNKYSDMFQESNLDEQLPDEIIENYSIYSILEKGRSDWGFQRLIYHKGYDGSLPTDLDIDGALYPSRPLYKKGMYAGKYIELLDERGLLKSPEHEDENGEREILYEIYTSKGNKTAYNIAFKLASINEIEKIISEWDDKLIESLNSLIFTNEKMSLSAALWILSDAIQPILDEQDIYLSNKINTNKLYNDICKPEFDMDLETLGHDGDIETGTTEITPQLWNIENLLLEPDEIEWNTFIRDMDYFIKSRSKIDRHNKLHFFDNLYSFVDLLSDKYTDRDDNPFDDIDYHNLRNRFNIENDKITLRPIWSAKEESEFIETVFKAISDVVSEKMNMFVDKLLEKNEGNSIAQMMIRNMQKIFEQPEALRSMTVTYVDQDMLPIDHDKKPVSDFIVKHIASDKVLHSASEILKTCVPDINYDSFKTFFEDVNDSLKIPTSSIRNKIYNMPVNHINRWKIIRTIDEMYGIRQYDDNGQRILDQNMNKIYQKSLDAHEMHILLIDRKHSPLLKHLRSRLTETYTDRFNADIVISTYPVDHMYRSTGQIWEPNSCERIEGAYDSGLIGDIAAYNPILYVNDENNSGWLGRVQLKHGKLFCDSWYEESTYEYPISTRHKGKHIFESISYNEKAAYELIMPDDRPYPNKDSYGIAQHRKLWDIFNKRYTIKQATFVNENFFSILRELLNPQNCKYALDSPLRGMYNVSSNNPSSESPMITLYKYPGYFMSNSDNYHRGWLVVYNGGMITNSKKIKYYNSVYVCDNCQIAYDEYDKYIPQLGYVPENSNGTPYANPYGGCSICHTKLKKTKFNWWLQI